MTPIYLLVKGMYETYTVLGVYTDRAQADEIADAINAEDTEQTLDARVEPIPLNPDIVDMLADALWLRSDHQYDAQLKDYERRKREAGIED